jgi:tryptophan synthase alpha chain
MLEQYIHDRLKEREILLMTHIVMGYPSFEASMEIVAAMVDAGVDLMELQIPFSEPIADGPVILAANQKALERGATVDKCMAFAREAAARFDIPFLFMSYYNILYRFGVASFTGAMAESRIRGAIVPDLPPEEGGEYMAAMASHRLDPIYIYAPTTPAARMKRIADVARGFIYCVARKGVTGAETDFSSALEGYLARCRQSTRLPLAVGFGVKQRADVDFLRGKADIAVVGSQTIRLMDREGPGAVGAFIRSLR